ncbi:SDR family oxidoreductase [bacterium]|nr:SDR family oxidoreductase [bacterium]NUN44153.1 SDR family oxidoreductase [bacterium]
MVLKVAVTGATGGIGAAAVKAWLAEGADVFAMSRTSKHDTTNDLKSRLISIPCDIRSEKSVEEAVSKISEHTPTLDVLVHCAGVGFFDTIENTMHRDWTQVIDTNLNGSFYLTKALLPLMRKSSKAHIFLVGSTAGRKGFIKNGAYSASKFGLFGFCEVLREEMRPLGIRVTHLTVGGVRTDFWEKNKTTFDTQTMIPPADIANTVVYAYHVPPPTVIEEMIIKPSHGDY